jgi:predicted permease
VTLWEDLVKDTRYALRLLGRSPAFALAAILSLAFGIAANTAVFSLVDAVLLRSLPVERPDELVFLDVVGPRGRIGGPTYPAYDRIAHETEAFSGTAAFAADELRVEVDGQPEQVFGQVVSSGYFELLGIAPARGRLLSASDDRLDPPAAVIGYGYWQRRFGGSPDVIGRTIGYANRLFTIVGITPAGFQGLEPGRPVDVTFPIALFPGMMANPDARWFTAIGRVRTGTSRQQAAAQADGVLQSSVVDRAGLAGGRTDAPVRLDLSPASRGMDEVRRQFSRPLAALWLVAALVLVIACANLATLLLTRGAARTREFAIRLATGAGRGRLLRQLLTETLVVFLLGAGAGLLLARVATDLLTGLFASGRRPILLDVPYDWRVAAFTAASALAAAVATGLWPAIRATWTDPVDGMKDGESRIAGSARAGAAGRLLVTSQVALSFVLLAAALMFARTLTNLRDVDLGFRPGRVLTMSLDPAFGPGDASTERQQFWSAMLERVRAMPGVDAASLSVLTPLSGRDTGAAVTPSGFQPRSEDDRRVHLNHVSDDYFATFGVALSSGREFTLRDSADAPKAAVINEAAAALYFEGRNPIGETLNFGGGRVYRIVGVAHDHKHTSVRDAAPRFVFVPLLQPVDRNGRLTLAVESRRPVPEMAREVAITARQVRQRTLIADVISVDAQIDATLLAERLLSMLAAAFALLALALAAVGLFGTLSYTVARRRPEFGVRIALGEAPSRVASSVVRQVMGQVVLGIALGAPIAYAIGRATQGLLFGVTPADPASYLLGAALLTLTASLSAWVPSRRAASTDPAETLRQG